MPEKRDNSYKNISFLRQESGRKNSIYCRGYLYVVVLKKSEKNHSQI